MQQFMQQQTETLTAMTNSHKEQMATVTEQNGGRTVMRV
jgi:hypothetical protein